jgi:hypothetical protein
MGLMGKIFGAGAAVREVGDAVGNVAEVLVGNQAQRDAAVQEKYVEAIGQFGSEFGTAGASWFDNLMNGLNRLPRPMLAIGTLGLFVYAMAEPGGFSERMQGLALVPDPLWWLLGAIVSFYFGARELHYSRARMASRLPKIIRKVLPGRTAVSKAEPPVQAVEHKTEAPVTARPAAPRPASKPVAGTVAVRASDPNFNAAVEEWRKTK